MVNPGIDSNTFFENWRHWRINEFQPEKVVESSGMTTDQTKELYGDLVSLGRNTDPLFEWFVLLQLINNAKKKRLMKGALLAQEYYKLARMVAFYIYDLTKEKMLDPDDYLDGVEGKWKTDIYGKPFNYQSRDTNQNLR